MPCTPSDNTLNPISIPGIPVPGFGIPFSPIQIPTPELDLPSELVEDILGLVNKISALFPSSVFKPNADLGMKTVLDMIMNVLTQLSPFLSFYNFIMAALNMFTCIIEILCAIPNPFAMALKLKKLFTECLPPFLNLFPWLALIIMIISFLLLILALIEYIINTIVSIVEAIIKNLEVLSNGMKLQDAQGTLAAIQKIASLLCFIQNILSVLVAIGALINIIETLALIAGGTICADNDADGCCAPDICPAFVKNTPKGINVSNGKLIYYNQIGANVADIFSTLNIPGIENLLTVPPIRSERWQLIDQNFLTATYPVASIITPAFSPTDPLSFNIFWPDPLEFKADMPPRKAPYTADIRVKLNPSQFGILDTKGIRFFRINNCIVVRKPYLGIINQSNAIDLSYLGAVLNIEGGLVFEDDNITPYLIDNAQATLNNFIHTPSKPASSNSDLPSVDDAMIFDDMSFTWKPNAGGLAGYQLVTIGCIPTVNAEKAVQNSIILAEGVESVLQKITTVMPDIATAEKCISDALVEFKKDVSPSGAAAFQSKTLSCLGQLQQQTTDIICAATNAAVSQFKSTIEIDTDIQFTSRSINAKVILKDATGTILSNNLPTQCVSEIQDKLKGEVTFGNISPFIYDGALAFNAKITSKVTGSGQLNVSFDNKIFNTVIVGDNNTSSSINENLLTYNFIETNIEPVPRRDETDISVNKE